VTLGLSAAGVASAFEKVRPYFLGVCAVLLGLGFYLVYFRKETCAPGTACATPNRRLTPFNQAMLWVAALLVTVFALFPKWAGVALSFAPSQQADLASPGLSTMSLRIDGMTCESCALTAQRAILAVPGVRDAKVLYTEREARITLDRTSPASTDALLAAVQKAGYEARIASDATDLPSLP
jgi:copper chaperone CopZ